MISACQKEQQLVILLDVETQLSPKLRGSILLSESHSTASYLRRKIEKKIHDLFRARIFTGRKCQNAVINYKSWSSNSLFSKTTSLTFPTSTIG